MQFSIACEYPPWEAMLRASATFTYLHINQSKKRTTQRTSPDSGEHLAFFLSFLHIVDLVVLQRPVPFHSLTAFRAINLTRFQTWVWFSWLGYRNIYCWKHHQVGLSHGKRSQLKNQVNSLHPLPHIKKGWDLIFGYCLHPYNLLLLKCSNAI